jgi:hypothetical protein
MVWPSGWVWHGGHGQYYLQMICGVYAVLGIFLIVAARDPSGNRTLISFTVWSSLVHAGIMAAQAIYDGQELGHLAGDVPALLLVAAVLSFLSPANQQSKGAYPPPGKSPDNATEVNPRGIPKRFGSGKLRRVSRSGCGWPHQGNDIRNIGSDSARFRPDGSLAVQNDEGR